MRHLTTNNTRILERPPRPRISRSPSLRMGKGSSGNVDEFAASPKKDEAIFGNGQPLDEEKYQMNQSDWLDLPVREHESTQAQLVSSTEQSVEDSSLIEPNFDVPRLKSWIEETSKVDPTSVYPSQPTRFTHLQSFEPRVSPPLCPRPEDDILAQWRLRRKIELAHSETRQRAGTAYSNFPYSWREKLPCQDCLRNMPSLTYSHLPITNSKPSWIVPSQNVYPGTNCCQEHFQRDMSVQTDSFDASRSTKNVACETTGLVGRKSTNMHTKSTFTRPITRSVGFTVSPRLKHVCVQCSMDFEQHPHPLASDPRHKASTCSSTIGAPQGILAAILGTVPEPNKVRLLRTELNDAEGESVQTTEADSWQWHSTPGTPEVSDLANLARSSPISRQAYPDCERKSSACEDQPVRDTPTSHLQYASFHETISRYLRETAPEVVSSRSWLHDPIVNDLNKRRDQCLLKLKSLLQEIHPLEIQLLESARGPEDG